MKMYHPHIIIKINKLQILAKNNIKKHINKRKTKTKNLDNILITN
jgi:hypothetical protein